MIHATTSLKRAHKARRSSLGTAFALGAAATLLGACAAKDTVYPSFSRPVTSDTAGRVAERFPDVAVPTIRAAGTPVEPLPAELDARLAAINARAAASSNAFAADLEPLRALARAASQSSRESDAWTLAQLRLADITTHHSRAHLALADLDDLTARAQLARSSAQERAMIADLHATLSQTIDEQARALSQINAQLSPPRQ